MTADHGEEFGEHGWVGWHAHTLYDELLLVPLILKFPGSRFAGVVENSQARGVLRSVQDRVAALATIYRNLYSH